MVLSPQGEPIRCATAAARITTTTTDQQRRVNRVKGGNMTNDEVLIQSESAQQRVYEQALRGLGQPFVSVARPENASASCVIDPPGQLLYGPGRGVNRLVAAPSLTRNT